MVATIRVTGPFDGPDFVKGLALQSSSYEVINSTTARLTFQGGIDPSNTYMQTLKGTGFGITSDGRYTGIVTSFKGVNQSQSSTFWVFTGLNTPLEIVNTNAAGDLSFADLLVSAIQYRFIGDQFDDNFATGPFDDLVFGKKGDDTFDGFSGSDTIRGGADSDTLSGNEGNDSLLGGASGDSLSGGTCADTLSGENGSDTVAGGTGADDIAGGSGQDSIAGNADGDTVSAGKGGDTVSGGAGADDISGGSGGDSLDGGAAGDTVAGNGGDDTINGNTGVDYLDGGGGRDSLSGDHGTDSLSGGEGKDSLEGGEGSDLIMGGIGNDLMAGNTLVSDVPDSEFDSFIFVGPFGQDTITDFEIGFDLIVMAGGIESADVSVKEVGDDVKVIVDFDGVQRILVEGVAGQFDPDIDILFN